MNLSNIIGSGFIAKSFKSYNDFFKKNKCILYAAGVSNSKSNNLTLFKKDFSRLKKIITVSNNLKLIYISSCSIKDPLRKNSIYLKTKIQNEIFIKKNIKNYLIIRLPEIIGKNKNKSTLVNYFYYKILNNKIFNLYTQTKRNFIHIDDIISILIEIVSKKISNKTINIASSKMTEVETIVKIFEELLNKRSKIIYKKKKFVNYNVDIKDIKKLKNFKKINFDQNYLKKNLKKYVNENI